MDVDDRRGDNYVAGMLKALICCISSITEPVNVIFKIIAEDKII